MMGSEICASDIQFINNKKTKLFPFGNSQFNRERIIVKCRYNKYHTRDVHKSRKEGIPWGVCKGAVRN